MILSLVSSTEMLFLDLFLSFSRKHSLIGSAQTFAS
jgi:hypothetical protein